MYQVMIFNGQDTWIAGRCRTLASANKVVERIRREVLSAVKVWIDEQPTKVWRRTATTLTITTFELDEQYFADVVSFGEVLHTTAGYIDWTSARFAALDWCNVNLDPKQNR